MRDRAERVRTEETRGEERFQGDDIKTRARRQTGTWGAKEGDKENTGGMRRENKGFSKQQLREEERRGRKTQWWMRQGSHGIERGKSFLKCDVQISPLFPSLSNTCHNSSL